MTSVKIRLKPFTPASGFRRKKREHLEILTHTKNICIGSVFVTQSVWKDGALVITTQSHARRNGNRKFGNKSRVISLCSEIGPRTGLSERPSWPRRSSRFLSLGRALRSGERRFCWKGTNGETKRNEGVLGAPLQTRSKAWPRLPATAPVTA